MPRLAVSLALAATGFLLVGLLVPLRAGVSIHLGGPGFGLSGRDCCFIFAAFLCSFAAGYSLWMLPLNVSAAHWHAAITAASALAFLLFFGFGSRADGQAGARIWVALIAEIFSGLTLLAGTAVFLINIAHAVVRITQHGFPQESLR